MMEISKEMARLFQEQCVGTYSGHMASIPNNPVLFSIFIALFGNEYDAREKFADALIAMGNALKS